MVEHCLLYIRTSVQICVQKEKKGRMGIGREGGKAGGKKGKEGEREGMKEEQTSIT